MYQALYRKYRPDTLSEVTGQEIITKTLKNAILNNKLTHAYLFTGPRGTGKTTIAKILAKMINCTDLKDLEPCNKCVNCTQIIQKQATDIIEIDAASNNGVDEIREIRNKVNLVPATGKYKIYIIDEVHMLTTGAFNALLKTLEEPPAHVIFVLATTEPHKIPSTILSRCQRFDFKKITINKLIERLTHIAKEEKINITKEAIEEIAYLSDGGMRDSISTLDQVIAYSDNEITVNEVHEINGTLTKKEMISFIEELFTKKLLNLLKHIDKFNNSGKNFIKLTEEIIIFLKNILLYQTIPNYFEEKIEEYELLSKKITTSGLIYLIELFNDALLNLRAATDPIIIFELIIIKYVNIEGTPDNGKGEIVKEIVDQPQPVPSSKEKNSNVFPPEETLIPKKTVPLNDTSLPKIEKSIDNSNLSLKDLQEIRINNTLAGFNKKTLLELKKSINSIQDLLLNPEYSQIISIILDGELKAASEKNLIFVYNTETLAHYFNENIIKIEEILEKTYAKHFEVISTTTTAWETIKTEFNSKKKEYKYLEESEDLKELIKSLKSDEKTDDFNNLFGDIVEYN